MDVSFEDLQKKISEMKKGGMLDLSLDEDLSVAVMNLVSLEEHFFFTGAKTGKDEYYAHLEAVREMRKELLGRMITKGEGETWCIAKHLLAAAMRLMEVGTKLQTDGKRDEAREMFKNAFQLYSLFWAVRLKVVAVDGVKKISEDSLDKHDEAKKGRWTVEDIVNKLVNCCDE